jgi:hypothetical protein
VSLAWIDEKYPQLRASISHLKRACGAINVALFLPFGCNKEQQTAASSGTKRSSKSWDSASDDARSGNVQHTAAKGA